MAVKNEPKDGVEFEDKLSLPEGVIRKNDLIAFEDPELLYSGSATNKNIHVGWIEGIRRTDEGIEFKTSLPHGEVKLTHHVKAIKGDDLKLDRDGRSLKFIDRFLSSDFAKHMSCKWSRNGDISVEGY